MAEKNLDLKITVLDENDCTPVIKAEQVGSVSESSAAGIERHKQIRFFFPTCNSETHMLHTFLW